MNRLMALSAFIVICILSWLVWPGPGVPILAYHQISEADDIYSVTAAQFEEQMSYLQDKGYTAISLEQLYYYYNGKISLPDKPIIITFDDGYEDNLLAALPIMEKYNMRSTVFVVSGLVGTSEYLSWQQIAEMQVRHTEIGSHTVSHISLGDTSPDQQRREVIDSKAILEQHVGSVKFFAYPFGQFTPITEEILREAGYLGACSGIAGLNPKGVDTYALKRVNVPHPKYGLGEFRLRLLRANIYSKLGI
ncbi:MAG: polysaccharide deacetylase [Firmicutes bacterium]|nr:polysaccharide deacetylase [Bacillota bacterium]